MYDNTDVIWKAIPGYKGFYEINNFGDVRSFPRLGTKGGILRWNVHPQTGYATVELCKKGIRKRYRVHRLVLLAFIGNGGELQVNHKNGNKLDNRLSNLEYMTQQENADHAKYVLGTIGIIEIRCNASCYS